MKEAIKIQRPNVYVSEVGLPSLFCRAETSPLLAVVDEPVLLTRVYQVHEAVSSVEKELLVVEKQRAEVPFLLLEFSVAVWLLFSTTHHSLL